MTKKETPYIENVIEEILQEEQKKSGIDIDIEKNKTRIINECRRCYLCKDEPSTHMAMFNPTKEFNKALNIPKDKQQIIFYGYGDNCIKKHGLDKIPILVETNLQQAAIKAVGH